MVIMNFTFSSKMKKFQKNFGKKRMNKKNFELDNIRLRDSTETSISHYLLIIANGTKPYEIDTYIDIDTNICHFYYLFQSAQFR